MNTTHSSRGFTIVELLVVIAIIAVLAAILFPMFARAKDSAYLESAMSSARQLGLAISMYDETADGKMLPSTNYGAPETAAERLWTTVLEPQVKSRQVFIAPASDGRFPDSWDERSWGTIGYNSSTALDEDQGCADDDQADKCLAFKDVVDTNKLERTTSIALFALTPGGELSKEYLGYEFSPYNGTPDADNPRLSPPWASDQDLVALLSAQGIPAELIKPIYARYLRTEHDDGRTPVIFADGHAKDYSAKVISDPSPDRIWRLR